ncbi:MAG TPA: CCA tRNA nucleotidyltransferase [Pirellulales bacterium]|nr:CCA tRNA nucleotidyltransferase [Pirellulales bacterium]
MSELDSNQQRDFALSVVRRLREAGHEAYWAGGCVRDCLMGRTPKDYDVATGALPEQIRELFGRRRTLEIGIAFGVVAVIGPKEAGIVEVTTFRHDASYSDGRHPDAVSFTTASEDAQRRDFTINGLFYDPLEPDESRRVKDFVGGVDDLHRRLIRAIGDPRARFDEDKLRMLRAIRFAATFDFSLDPGTRQAMVELANTLTVVSAERIAQEMRAILVHPRRAAAVRLLRETRLLSVVLPELTPLADLPVDNAAPQGESLWERTLAVLEALDQSSFPLALAALLHATGWHSGEPAQGFGAAHAAEAVRQVSERWRLSNKDAERAAWLAEHHRALIAAETMPWPRLQRLLICPGIDELLDLHAAIASVARHGTSHVDDCRRKLALPEAEWNPPPLLSGDDLKRHGIPPGKAYKALLDRVRDAQLERQVSTLDEALALVDRLRRELPLTGGGGSL